MGVADRLDKPARDAHVELAERDSSAELLRGDSGARRTLGDLGLGSDVALPSVLEMVPPKRWDEDEIAFAQSRREPSRVGVAREALEADGPGRINGRRETAQVARAAEAVDVRRLLGSEEHEALLAACEEVEIVRAEGVPVHSRRAADPREPTASRLFARALWHERIERRHDGRATLGA